MTALLFHFSDRGRCPDHDESRNRHYGGRRCGHDHSRGDGGGGDDSATHDVARHRRPLSSRDLNQQLHRAPQRQLGKFSYFISMLAARRLVVHLTEFIRHGLSSRFWFAIIYP
jgi:hypothetical protein